MNLERIHTIVFLILLGAGLVVTILLLKPFFTVLVLAAIVSIMLQPIKRLLSKHIASPNLLATSMLVSLLVIVIAPIIIFGQVITQEALDAYQDIRDGNSIWTQSDLLQYLPPNAVAFINDLTIDVGGFINRAAGTVAESVSSLISNVAGFLFSVFIFFFITFFFLRDGEVLAAWLQDILPLPGDDEKKIFDRIVESVHAVVTGSFFLATIQGIVAMVGFFIFGVPLPVLWGLVAMIAALVPNLGTSLVLVPVIIYLILSGHVLAAGGMAIWGVLAVGLIDNFLGPKIISSRVKIHPLLVFLSVLGGLQLFGIIGFLLGPIVMAVVLAMIDIYRSQAAKW